MQIYSALQIGEYHLNHCEDYLVIEEIGNNKLLCAVLDGCTMANESYFAATLAGKILKKIAKVKGYKELYALEPATTNMDSYLLSILQDLFQELNSIKNQLLLDQKDLLTTLLLLLVDKKENHGIILVIGDGIISINGQVTEFDQDNKPDYLGFHLNENVTEWYQRQKQKVTFTQWDDISIATDGILTFTRIAEKQDTGTIDPIHLLLQDSEKNHDEDMLQLKLKKLEHVYGLKPTDDLAVIRISRSATT
ncbi:Protein phosphatase 2C [Filimonas lacunae]|uniref:Protein phosphatase 2C n=1 Tax=Filimonas lacunae TaxID=477680 RepID=A0A173MKF3_9BACT|nr:protein phosphatase 2C domain-containing protein [Filimonas lacunae]BAV07970.1 hypothetical protein FLA_4002 [Filimonas lacunae]SIT07278.1 Protein phosphatase 2C [Filimonas lacunae]